MATIKCGNCGQVHGSVAEVRNCYAIASAPKVMSLHTIRGDVGVPVLDEVPDLEPRPDMDCENLITDKQIGFIKLLGKKRDISNLDALVLNVDKVEYDAHRLYTHIALEGGVTTKQVARALIDMLLGLPWKPKTDEKQLEAGMYKVDGSIYKVQKAVHGSGNMYAKKLVYFDPNGHEAKVAGDGGGWFFEYAKGAMRFIKPEHKMTLEQAKEFGTLYGTCCACGRTLTNEASIEAGIGSKCAAKMGY